MSRIWKGDWWQRIYERLNAQGYSSATAFSEANPRASFLELTAQLGNDVAAVQLETILQKEAVDRGTLPAFARSALVRYLREQLPAGWGVGEKADFRRASAFGSWYSAIGGEAYGESLKRAWGALRAANPPHGWLPEGPDDPLLLQAFQGVSFPLPDPGGEKEAE